MQKEQILELLWPDLLPESAENHFKVALNAMQKVLEPDRPPRTPSFFVQRRGTSYGFMLGPSVLIDCELFEAHIKHGQRAQEAGDRPAAISHFQRAINLYQGDYLAQWLYEDWTIEERERLLGLYLHTAERLARLRLQSGQPAEAVALAEAILSRDEYWEAAYRLLMMAHYRTGNRPQALRAYERCSQALQDGLGVSPMRQTERLYKRLLYHQSISIQDA